MAIAAALSTPTPAATVERSVTGGTRVLVFTKANGYRHESIDDGVRAFQELAATRGIEIVATEDAEAFDDASLQGYAAVVFLSTTGDILAAPQEAAFERYITGGGGFVGVHAASTTEYDWPWYGTLVGARFVYHPPIQPAVLRPEGRAHPSTEDLPRRWQRSDEWYAFDRNPRPDVHVLLSVSERTYEGGTMGSDHPLAWCHRIDRGRSWYTALGHEESAYAEETFRRHLLGGLVWAAGLEPGRCDPSEDEEVLAARRIEGGVDGSVYASPRCSRRRSVQVFRVRRGPDRIVGRDRADRLAVWRVDGLAGAGPYRAVAPRTVACSKLRSGLVG